MMNDEFEKEMPSQSKEILLQAVGHEPLDHDPSQQSPSLLHASHGISQQQTFRNDKPNRTYSVYQAFQMMKDKIKF